MLATFLTELPSDVSVSVSLSSIYYLSSPSVCLPVFVFLYLCLCCRHSVASSCLTLWGPVDDSLPGSFSVGFSRQEYWSKLPCLPSRGSSLPRDQTRVSCLTDRSFTAELPGRSISASIIFLSPPISIYHLSIYLYLRMCVCLYVFMCVCVSIIYPYLSLMIISSI